MRFWKKDINIDGTRHYSLRPARRVQGWRCRLLGFCTAVLAACGASRTPLIIQSAAIDTAGLNVHLQWEPDAVVLDALDHGIALQFKVEVEAQGAPRLGWRPTLANSDYRIELRYFPLSRQYRWRDLDHGDTRNYSARSLLIGALENLHLSAPEGFRAAGIERYLLKIQLQRDALPGALRLPALLDSKWHMASGDYTWQAPAAG